MTAYIKTDATKESPERSGKYITETGLHNCKRILWRPSKGWHNYEYSEMDGEVLARTKTPDYWYKEINLSELMIDFVAWKDSISYEDATYNELVAEFLAQKGIVIK